MKELDINQVPSLGITEDREEEGESPNGFPSPSPIRRKKLRLTKEQSRLLEESFRQNQTLTTKHRESFAEQLKLKARQVEVWFQNRRARSKMRQLDMEWLHLKAWFVSLTEQNRRLHKEVEELKAINAGGRRLPLPSSTLTTCPCCQRVTAATNFSFSAAPPL